MQEDIVRPTKKQRELVDFIGEFIREHGYSPSYREIMFGLDYTSVATVSLHVNNLITRGHLRKRDRSARSLEVVSSDAAAAPAKPLPDLVARVKTLLKSAELQPAEVRQLGWSLTLLGYDDLAAQCQVWLDKHPAEKGDVPAAA